jgi:hypothetical protein
MKNKWSKGVEAFASSLRQQTREVKRRLRLWFATTCFIAGPLLGEYRQKLNRLDLAMRASQ